MKRVIFIIGTLGSLSTSAQSIDEWLTLDPIPVSLPAFSETKNVDNLPFSPAKLLQHAFVNVASLSPAPDYTEEQ